MARGISLHLNLPPVEVAQVALTSLRSSPSKQRGVLYPRCDGPETQFFAANAMSFSPQIREGNLVSHRSLPKATDRFLVARAKATDLDTVSCGV